jgi:hypothetical protein
MHNMVSISVSFLELNVTAVALMINFWNLKHLKEELVSEKETKVHQYIIISINIYISTHY